MLEEKLHDGLSLIDKSYFKDTQKLWILQHLLIPRIQWPLLIYEVSMSCAITLEQKVSTFIRKWLHLLKSTSNVCLYGSCSPCPLPIRSLTSILKSAKISGHLLLRDSKDPLVSSTPPALKAGRCSVGKAGLVKSLPLNCLKRISAMHTGKSSPIRLRKLMAKNTIAEPCSC